MKAKDVLKILNISRITLYNYTKEGKIKANKMSNGCYDYDEESIFKIINKDSRINVIYARVSTSKKKHDLENQINQITSYCNNNNIIINKTYSDIHSGIDLDRPNFNNLLDDIIKYKIKNIYITFKDRLTRLSFKTLESLFNKYQTKIIEINNSHTISNDYEIFEELINLMHIFFTTMYSNRRKNKIYIYKK